MRTGWYLFIQALCACIFRIFYHLRIHGSEHVPGGGCIIAGNHVSYFDPPLIGCTLESGPHYLARKTLFKPPVMDRLIASLQAHPIDQERPDMAGLKRIIELTRKGQGVVLFPEGSRSWDGVPQPAQPGVGLVVAKSGVPVVPVRIFGGHEAWPRGKKPRIFKKIDVVFAPPISLPPGKDRDAYQAIGDRIMEAINAIELPTD